MRAYTYGNTSFDFIILTGKEMREVKAELTQHAAAGITEH
jgi:hypothetical protein